MKRLKDKIWFVGILFFLTHCFSFESTEEKELKQIERNLWIQLFLFQSEMQYYQSTNDICSINYWGTTYYRDVAHLYKNGNRDCAPVTRFDLQIIYNDKGQKLGESTNEIVPLQCRVNIVNGYLVSTTVYSWYRQTGLNPLRADFVFQHTVVQDESGKAIGVDSFTNYSKGDVLYCCAGLSSYLPACQRFQVN